MAKFNAGERTVLGALLIGAGLLLIIASGGFMLLGNSLDGLSGAGNPSAESMEQARQDSIFRNLVLMCLIAAGGGLAFFGFLIMPRRREPEQAGGTEIKSAK